MNKLNLFLYFLLGILLTIFGLAFWQVIVTGILVAVIEVVATEGK